jgi:hypothetical protein
MKTVERGMNGITAVTVKCLCVAALCLNVDFVRAQSENTHEFAFYGAGGMTNLMYKLSEGGSKTGGFGGGAGVSYTYNFSYELGLSAGAEITSYSGNKADYKTIAESYSGIDDNGDEVKYEFKFDNYTENQKVTMFSVPVKLVYRLQLSNTTDLYAAGGVKVGLPVSAKSDIGGKVTSAGYYSYEDLTYHDLQEHGFFTDREVNAKGKKIDLGIAAMLSFEAGFHFCFGENAGLYAGLFIDYGMNDMRKAKDRHLVNCNEAVTYESVLNTGLSDKLNLMSVGVKLQFAFGW